MITFSAPATYVPNPEVLRMMAENLKSFTDAQLEQSLKAVDAGHPMEALLVAELDRRMSLPVARATADHGIEEWEAQAPAAPIARIAIEDAGVYLLPNGDVVRVKANKAKTRTYASRWVASKHLDRLMEAGAHEHGEYVYEQGLVAEVARVGRKMSLEEAKAHSIRYGQCVRCGRRLTDGKSVEQGMGPVCIKFFS